MKELLVTFDLHNAAPSDYSKAYAYLATFGFQGADNNVFYPNTVVCGIWQVDATPVGQIRDGLRAGLIEEGLSVKAILVAEVAGMAWFGNKVKP